MAVTKIQMKNRIISERMLNGTKKWIADNGAGYLFMAPFLILFAIFIIAPVFVSLSYSFTNYNMIQPAKWVGINNYKLLFTDDDIFFIGIKNTFVFALIVGPAGYMTAFFAAWIINNMRLKTALTFAFYAPTMAGAGASVLWKYIFSSDRYGLINDILVNKLRILNEPVLWTESRNTILLAAMVVQIWMSTGTQFLVFVAGLQNLPKSYYEAAKIDGLSGIFNELRFLTLPLMKPQLLFGAILSITGSFGVFSIISQIAGFPTPNYAGRTIVGHLYDYAFTRYQMGYGSAVAVVLFIITFSLGKLIRKLLASNDE